MGLGDKISNATEEAVGKAKESFGKATDNESLEAEGKFDQAKADAKQGVEDVKDSAATSFNETVDRVRGS